MDPQQAKPPFIHFAEARLATLRSEQPDKSFGDLALIVSREWSSMSEKQKYPFSQPT